MLKIKNDKVVNGSGNNNEPKKMPYKPFDPNKRERITDSFNPNKNKK